MSFTDYEKEPSEKFESLPPKSSKYKRGVVTTPTAYYYVLNNDRVCEIDSSVSHLSLILQVLSKNLSPDLWLWVAVPLNENCVLQTKKFVEEGFGAPYIGGSTPFGKKIPHSVCLLRKNKSEAPNPKRGMLNVMYIIQQYTLMGETCSLFARFNTQAITFLRKTSKMGHTKNGDDSVSQKELGGRLYVENIERSGNNNKYVFVIGVDKDKVESGVEEEIMVAPTRYNFHSHPKEAYVRYGVKYGWPSVTDYLGYLTLGNNTIFHCVATLEGLYVLSFGPYWVNRLKEVNKKFVKKNYDIRGQGLNPTPFEYVKIVNSILVEGHPLFLVKFLPWTGASRSIFSVTYKKEGLGCEPNDKNDEDKIF